MIVRFMQKDRDGWNLEFTHRLVRAVFFELAFVDVGMDIWVWSVGFSRIKSVGWQAQQHDTFRVLSRRLLRLGNQNAGWISGCLTGNPAFHTSFGSSRFFFEYP